MGANLAARRIRLLFVADDIPDSLTRIVSFLNEQTRDNIEVLAVEIKQFSGKTTQTLVPRVIGLTAAAPAKSGPRTKLTRESFLAEFTGRERDAVEPPQRDFRVWRRPWLEFLHKVRGSFIPCLGRRIISHRVGRGILKDWTSQFKDDRLALLTRDKGLLGYVEAIFEGSREGAYIYRSRLQSARRRHRHHLNGGVIEVEGPCSISAGARTILERALEASGSSPTSKVVSTFWAYMRD